MKIMLLRFFAHLFFRFLRKIFNGKKIFAFFEIIIRDVLRRLDLENQVLEGLLPHFRALFFFCLHAIGRGSGSIFIMPLSLYASTNLMLANCTILATNVGTAHFCALVTEKKIVTID